MAAIDDLICQVADFARYAAKKRQLSQASYSLWTGYSSEVGGDEDVSTRINEISQGVYDIFVVAPPGEYCFIFTFNGTGVYNSVFDFSIIE